MSQQYLTSEPSFHTLHLSFTLHLCVLLCSLCYTWRPRECTFSRWKPRLNISGFVRCKKPVGSGLVAYFSKWKLHSSTTTFMILTCIQQQCQFWQILHRPTVTHGSRRVDNATYSHRVRVCAVHAMAVGNVSDSGHCVYSFSHFHFHAYTCAAVCVRCVGTDGVAGGL
jgi:hypothetical protein